MEEKQFGDRKVVCLPIGHKKWVGDCPPNPTGSAANGFHNVL